MTPLLLNHMVFRKMVEIELLKCSFYQIWAGRRLGDTNSIETALRRRDLNTI